MLLVLQHNTKAHDHGDAVAVGTLDFIYRSNRGYLFYKTPNGVFRRHENYWEHSPYGWERVLPAHLDKWGMQI